MSLSPSIPILSPPADSGGREDGVLWLRGMAGGEKRALQLFFQAYGATLLGVALQMLGSKEDAEEVLQDTMTRLWQKAGEYDPAKGRPFTWAVMILRGLCLDRLRARRRRLDPVALPPHWDAPALGLWEAGTRLDMQAAYDGLSAEEQSLLQRAVFGSLTAAEVAAEDHEPLGTVKSRLRRTLQKFFLRIRGEEENEKPTFQL